MCCSLLKNLFSNFVFVCFVKKPQPCHQPLFRTMQRVISPPLSRLPFASHSSTVVTQPQILNPLCDVQFCVQR
eukprot:m.249986 g.249986  ORF g.249986 m.249986 type:complete len:73 (+) comp19093_c0_seq1:46-264(+)